MGIMRRDSCSLNHYFDLTNLTPKKTAQQRVLSSFAGRVFVVAYFTETVTLVSICAEDVPSDMM